MNERVAILVIHGIGQQRPYETLDQFTRHLMDSLSAKGRKWIIQPQLDEATDPTRVSKIWTRASFNISPADGKPAAFASDTQSSIQDISLFEYYWAPITQDKISYIGSLLFLIRAGLQPFLYVASNLNALGKAQAKKRFWIIVFKEIFRQAAFFLPLLLFLVSMLWWLKQASITMFAKGVHVNIALVLLCVVLAIRYLYIYSSVQALKQSFQVKTGWQTDLRWRAGLLLTITAHLFGWPWLLALSAWLITRLAHLVVGFQYLAFVGNWSSYLHNLARDTAFPWTQPSKWFAALLFLDPGMSQPLKVAFTLLLAYFVRYILIDYVGDIAVYVNSSAFSKTFAARTQIMEECSATLSGLLLQRYQSGPRKDKPIYDRVLIAAHSLGSVIGYDTMTELLNAARTADPREPSHLQPSDLDNLRGIITFGSPLNKTFYFFREVGDPRQTLRWQTLDLLHGFRLTSSDFGALAPPFVPNPDPRWSYASAALDKGFKWINAYSIEDPISGRIVFYKVDKQLHFNYTPFIAHLRYWQDPAFYTFFRDNLL